MQLGQMLLEQKLWSQMCIFSLSPDSWKMVDQKKRNGDEKVTVDSHQTFQEIEATKKLKSSNINSSTKIVGKTDRHLYCIMELIDFGGRQTRRKNWSTGLKSSTKLVDKIEGSSWFCVFWSKTIWLKDILSTRYEMRRDDKHLSTVSSKCTLTKCHWTCCFSTKRHGVS